MAGIRSPRQYCRKEKREWGRKSLPCCREFPHTWMKTLIRPVYSHWELQQVHDVEQAVWQAHTTPISLLRVFADHGGLILGAYNESERMVGMSAAFAARYQGLWYLHSHMMAVLPSYRLRGIGRELKQYQINWALQNGYDFVGWTFDPLQKANAHFNLTIFKAHVLAFLPNYYGSLHDTINHESPTHRFFVGFSPQWPSCRISRARELVPLPEDISRLREKEPAEALKWAQYYAARFTRESFSVLGLAFSPGRRLCYIVG